MRRKPLCVDCEKRMGIARDNMYVLIMDDRERPYLLWACELFSCPECGHQTAVNFADTATKRVGNAGFDELVEKLDRENRLIREY